MENIDSYFNVAPNEEKNDFIDQNLRPQNFKDYIGQEKVIENLEIMVQSALIRKRPLDHILLAGPPGLGKTTLGLIISKSLNRELHVLPGPSIEKKGDLAAVLTNLAPMDVLFIDEIHRMPVAIEEILYSAMEDFRLDILIGQGPAARAMRIDINPFTLVGATTKGGLLSGPLRDRFMAHFNFSYYDSEHLKLIIEKNAQTLSLRLNSNAARLIARRARGTPRLANRILRRLRDFILVKEINLITEEVVEQSLDLLGIDEHGLNDLDREILKVMDKMYNGGPVGIDALSSVVSEDRRTIEDVYEPYLVKLGFIIRTPRGRMLSSAGKTYVDLLGKIKNLRS